MWPKAKRAVSLEAARQIAGVAKQHSAQAAGVFVDEDAGERLHNASSKVVVWCSLSCNGTSLLHCSPEHLPNLESEELRLHVNSCSCWQGALTIFLSFHNCRYNRRCLQKGWPWNSAAAWGRSKGRCVGSARPSACHLCHACGCKWPTAHATARSASNSSRPTAFQVSRSAGVRIQRGSKWW